MSHLPAITAAVILVAYILLSGIVVQNQVQASDRDVDPYLIYIDPVTGKYSTQKPGHTTTPTQQVDIETSVVSDAVPASGAPLGTIFVLSGGILLTSHLLAIALLRLRTR